MFEGVETQLWVTKAVRQRIPSPRAQNSKMPTTEIIQSVARYNELPLTGRPQMLTTSNVTDGIILYVIKTVTEK